MNSQKQKESQERLARTSAFTAAEFWVKVVRVVAALYFTACEEFEDAMNISPDENGSEYYKNTRTRWVESFSPEIFVILQKYK